MNHTKIICTIGPASESRATMRELMESGMGIARLNFSHGTHKHHKLIIDNVRAVSKKINRPCAILQDLQGPRMRVGTLHKPLEVMRGEEVLLVFESRIEEMLRKKDDTGKIIPLGYDLSKSVHKGDFLLIDDGLVELTVKRVRDGAIYASVKTGGPIGAHKGINVPGREIAKEVITEKDNEDLRFGLKHGVDLVALSFVSSADDMRNLKKLIKKHTPQNTIPPLVVAKIEREIAVRNIDEIIAESDAVMVARGDLGLEIDVAEVPLVQKQIISKCLAEYTQVIVATQMLESMVRKPRPTRAEATDVAAAVVDHTDALMLSAETAFGKYPVAACKTMAKIAGRIEQSHFDDMQEVPLHENCSQEEALAHAVWSLSREVKAKVVIVTTMSGHTARMIARFRPQVPIVVTCANETIERQLLLTWGVIPFVLPQFDSIDDLIEAAVEKVKTADLAKNGDSIVLVSGQPTGKGGANLVKVHKI